MFDSFKYLIQSKREAERAREALMEKVREVTSQGTCVILSGTPEGTRVIVIGKSFLERQLEEILKGAE